MISYTGGGGGAEGLHGFICHHLAELHAMAPGRHYELSFAPELGIGPAGRPRERFFIDLLAARHLGRLGRSGQRSEALLRSVAVRGRISGLLIDDASAGLGRDGLLLHCAGAKVRLHERHVLVWALLCDALARAGRDPRSAHLPHGLPQLCACSTYPDPLATERPDVIYFDPMYPAARTRGQVRRDMQLFRELVGCDPDQGQVLCGLRRRARFRVVVKRPRSASPLLSDVSYHIAAGQCRFDCYVC